jgi:hypothetical protein
MSRSVLRSIDTGYYATFNRDNVTLIDLRSTPIEVITRTGLSTSDASYELDSIVFATPYLSSVQFSVALHGGTFRRAWVRCLQVAEPRSKLPATAIDAAPVACCILAIA